MFVHIVAEEGCAGEFIFAIVPCELYSHVVGATWQTLDVQIFLVWLILHPVGPSSVSRFECIVHGLYYCLFYFLWGLEFPILRKLI